MAEWVVQLWTPHSHIKTLMWRCVSITTELGALQYKHCSRRITLHRMLLLLYLCIYVCMSLKQDTTWMWSLEDNFQELALLFPRCESWESNSCCQSWQQAPLPIKPFCRPCTLFSPRDRGFSLNLDRACQSARLVSQSEGVSRLWLPALELQTHTTSFFVVSCFVSLIVLIWGLAM